MSGLADTDTVSTLRKDDGAGLHVGPVLIEGELKV